MTENWLPVPGWEDLYEVSDLGHVRNARTRHALSIYTGDKYAKVRLKRAGGGSTKNVHQLVAEAFLGPRPKGLEVCHNNGQRQENHLSNLRYDTHSENALDIVRHGRHHYAIRTHCRSGHEYSETNTYIRPGGARTCRTCDRARSRQKAA